MASAPGMDRYRPRYEADAGPPASPAGGPNAMYQFQGSQWQGRGGPPRGGDFTFRQGRPRVSDRPLLAGLRGASPDPVFRGADTVEKFRQADDLTDSDEEDMDFSQSDDDEEQRPSKRLRSGPSWSNPDPYTALPPVTENQKKKHDVVKLIRKSRITPPAAQPTSAAGANDEDFISFDMNDSTIEFGAEHRNEAPANAPTGPKNQQSDASTQLGKRKRDPVDDVSKLPPRANRGARLHQQGKILREWRASNLESSTPWYLPPVIPHVLPGIA
jgi:non-canonical poly(A) RNA polymerase PAPD5/7